LRVRPARKRNSSPAEAFRDVRTGATGVHQINHLAIISENYTTSAKFYEVMFGMRTSPGTRSERAMTVGDGYLGLNINPRSTGRPARLDHFGVEVDDVERVYAALRERYPAISLLKRPSNRPFAGITAHDPDGNVFDLSQKDMSNRAGVYAEAPSETHCGTSITSPCAASVRTSWRRFYRDMLELEKVPAAAGDPSHYLTDGRVTLVISPWNIADYAGTSITAPCIDHIGFRVGDVGEFLAHVERLASENRQIAPYPVGSGPEGRARLELARTPLPAFARTTSPIPIRSYSACGLSAPETRLTVPFDTVTVTVTVAVLLFASLNVTLAEPAASAVTMNVVAPDAGETLATVALSDAAVKGAVVAGFTYNDALLLRDGGQRDRVGHRNDRHNDRRRRWVRARSR